MPIDSTIPLGFKPTDPMQSLKGLLDVQQSTLNYNKSRDTYDAEVLQKKAEASSAVSKSSNDAINAGEKQSLQKALADPSQFTSPDGTVDFNKLLPLAMRVAPTTGMEHVKSILAAQTASTEGKAKLMDMSAGARAYLSRAAYAMKGQPPDVINKGLDALAEQSPELKDSLPWLQKSMTSVFKSGGQQGLDEALDRTGKGLLDVPAQQTANTPNAVPVTDGAEFSAVNTKPGVAGIAQYGEVPGMGGTVKPPPTTPILGPDGKTPGIIGPLANRTPGQFGASSTSGPITQNERQQAQAESNAARNDLASQIQPRQSERAQAVAEGNTANVHSLDREMGRLQGQSNTAGRPVPATSGFMATGMAPGQESNLKDNTEAMNTHFAKISGVASDAPLALSLVSNIKSLAKGAITGTLQGRTAYVNGLLNSVHLGDKISGDLQKDTDLLEKYLSQLNLSTPASTNAAREIITAARPHGTMINGALTEAADQIGSVVNSNLAQRNHLASYKFGNGGKGDPIGYDTEKRNIESIADPRIFQMQGKSRDEIKAYMAKLPIADQQDLVRKSGLLHQMGITK